MADVDALIADARTYAASTIQSAFAELSNASGPLNSIGGGLVIPVATITDPKLPSAFEPAIPPTLTPYTMVEYVAPTAPSNQTPVPSPMDGIDSAPTFSVSAPTYTDPQRPGQVSAFGVSLPVIQTNFSFPVTPAGLSQVFEVPVLTEHTAPIAPSILLPAFTATAPTDLPDVPSDYAAQFTAAYHEHAPAMYSALDGQMDAFLTRMNPEFHTQLAAIESKLTTFLAGGTALTNAVQDAIYERSKDKNAAEYRRTRDAAFKDAARRGFTMPSGALASALQKARQDGADNNARAATDIAVKMAELEQQNMQFAITTSAGMRASAMSAMIAYHQNLITINGQALEAAKSVLSALVQIYDTAVKAFNLRLEAYKADAAVYDTKLRAAMSAVELYKAEIDALEALTRVDVAKVEIYKAEVDSLTSLASAYRTQVDAVVAQASLEKLKIDMYGAQVQAYSTQVQAKSAEYQAYASAINGEEAKTRVYAERVRAYATEVTAWKAKIEGKTEQIRAIASTNQAIAENYRSLVAAYSAKVSAQAQIVSTKIDYGREMIQGYTAANQAAIASAQSRSDLYRTQTQVAMERSRLSSTKLLEESKINVEIAKAIATNSIAAGDAYGRLASAALAGMNTLVVNQKSE